MREELACAIPIREMVANKRYSPNSISGLLRCPHTDSLLQLPRSVIPDHQPLEDRTKKEEARRHQVRMKKTRQFYPTKWRSRTEIGQLVRKKSDGGLIEPRSISWALFVCVLFIVSCGQQNCDRISQEQQQQKRLINGQYSVDGSPGIRLFTSDIGTSRVESSNSESPDWFGDESAQSMSHQKFQLNNRPHFKAKQARRVIASRWQTEVFLPCQIENLDEEQTVSKSG